MPVTDEPSAWGAAVSPSEATHFRPDIEGLRAVAVLAVLLYHAQIPFVVGGFIGVDVFYVISGFLITGLLLRELSGSGRISLTTFYSRRARRLLPAALFVILATLGMSFVALSVIEFRNVTLDAAAAALYVSNYRFAFQATDYLAAQEPSPLLHYWSLGVEEQFYLFWPLLVMLSARLLGVRRLWWVIVVGGLASFALSVWLTTVAQPWAFFSLPTRAWELGLGALVAVGLVAIPKRRPVLVASVLGFIGLAAIGLSAVLIRPDMPFPGVLALIPALGAALVILSGERQQSVVARVLATRPARWVGRISYSLYLWHWPILILIPVLIGRDDLATRLVLIAFCFVLAEVSTRFVESPFRHGRLTRVAAKRVIAVALAMSVTVAAVSVASGEIAVQRLRGTVAAVPTASPSPTLPPPTDLPPTSPLPPTLAPSAGTSPPVGSESPAGSVPPSSRGSPAPTDQPPVSTPQPTPDARPPLPPPVVSGPVPLDTVPTLLDASADVPRSLVDGCQVPVIVVAPRDCAYGVLDSPVTVALLGDSHAAQWLPAIEQLAAERGWRILPLTKASCPPVDQLVWLNTYSRPFDECLQWREAALAEIEAAHPAIVFVSFLRSYDMVVGDQRVNISDDPQRWQDSVVRLLERVAAGSDRAVYIADTPRHGSNPVNCLASARLVEECPIQRADLLDPGYEALEDAAAAEARVELVRPADWLCDATVCPLIFGNNLVYRDDTHITATFSGLLAPILGWELDQGP